MQFKVGDRVGIKGKPYTGFGDVVFWNYIGWIECIFTPEHTGIPRARVLRDKDDPTDWFVADLDNLEMVDD